MDQKKWILDSDIRREILGSLTIYLQPNGLQIDIKQEEKKKEKNLHVSSIRSKEYEIK